MAEGVAQVAGAGCCGFCGLLLLFSFASLAPTQMALQYNSVFKTVSPRILTSAGLMFVGPWTSLIKYPKTIQTIEYTQEDMLDGRTFDGLPLNLGLSFQYSLLKDDKSLFTLYHKFESSPGDYITLYKLIGKHMITELATNFTAYQFFNEKQTIATIMREQLDQYFRANLFASVESLQINEDDLPRAFTDSVLMAATSKQNITRMMKTKDAKVVEFTTARQVAAAQANVTVAGAMGERHRILQNGRADAAIIEAYVEAERRAYSAIKQTMNLSGDDLIKYIWYDTLGGGSVSSSAHESADIQMMVGVDPAAYISQVTPS
uniref:Band 7 domain-containing protein n=1 Tax=Alexandrium catenella TaxID=2925 RepID=A0A7S1KYB9_ALECA|mmetsp:Transcript_10261/g.27844  ORF Transcript_10261/g.27844 Transcript_10261/m.27844 type:complete len:319 (+) Transcript_10261:56-1012(+)